MKAQRKDPDWRDGVGIYGSIVGGRVHIHKAREGSYWVETRPAEGDITSWKLVGAGLKTAQDAWDMAGKNRE